jgi:hypothetical protein
MVVFHRVLSADRHICPSQKQWDRQNCQAYLSIQTLTLELLRADRVYFCTSTYKSIPLTEYIFVYYLFPYQIFPLSTWFLFFIYCIKPKPHISLHSTKI